MPPSPVAPASPATRPRRVPPHPLAGLAAALGVPAPAAAAGVAVTGITHASTEVRPGDVYAGLLGQRTHGARFASDAAGRGAVGLLTDAEGAALAAPAALPTLVVPDPRRVLGDAAAWVYDFPARRLRSYGVTGTNGKTTVTMLLHAVLTAVAGPAGLVGTIETRIGERVVPSVRTTPEASDLQALLAVMVEDGVVGVALEVSSHALVLGRVGGLVLDVAGFTQLSQDHLDFHGTMEAYYRAKASLFTPERSRHGVVVVDDEWGRRLAAESSVPVTTVAVRPDEPDHPAVRSADWSVEQVRPASAGHVADVRGPDGRRFEVAATIPGLVNVSNAVLTLAMAVAGGLDGGAVVAALADAPPVAGRMEVVSHDPFVVVDYAHTPDAVASALQTLRATGRAPLVVVLGAGGDRDATKRGPMGRAAAQGADLVVVTDDNPRSEDPATIRAAVRAGAEQVDPARVVEVGDRAEAIALAVQQARGGTVLVAGKGHEQGQEVAGVVHPFDDRAVVRALLQDGGAR